MISGVEGRLPYMTYPEPWRGPPKQLPELFLRPAPKPLTQGYNGINDAASINGNRQTKFPPSTSIQAPINLVYGKNEPSEEMPYNPRIMSHSPQLTHFPYTLYQQQQQYMMRPSFPPTPTMSPLEPFSVASSNVSTFLSPPPTTFSPPVAAVGLPKAVHEKRSPLPPPPNSPSQQAFKIPCGKEGSLKYRFLARPDDGGPRNVPLDLQKSAMEPRKRLQATLSPTSPTPPRSPKKLVNNNGVMSSFTKGSLIKLANGDLKRIEDMKTEDFISSAEKSVELRLAESTVVKIEENRQMGNAIITLKYNKMNAQVEIESSLEHPYFVIGQGWASCHPERTQMCYKLIVYRLQVGDVIISLTPREKPSPIHPSSTARLSSTVITTATSTTMTSKQISSNNNVCLMPESSSVHHQQHQQHHPKASVVSYEAAAAAAAAAAETLAARKRRWSAPDQICDDNIEQVQKRRVE